MSSRVATLVVKVSAIACMMFLSVSIVCLSVSLNPDVKWNEYNEELFGTGIYAYYYNTLWDSIDLQQYEGKPGSGNYVQIINSYAGDSWKVDTQFGVMKAFGLTSGSLFLLIVALSIHAVTEQKLCVVISNILSIIMGLTAGGLCMQAIFDYKKNLVKGILASASMKPALGGYYFPELEFMKLGYWLVYYGGIIIITVCSLLMVQCALYVKFSEGKWIWKEKTGVASSEIHQ